jgi:hypothetical protein
MSNLLEQASLVMIPSGYKEDVVYSEIPLDGSGDMVFTRASDGTRVNFDGLVEVVPWNLLPNSQTFASWAKVQISGSTVTVTDNFVTAPNGTLTGAKVVFSTFDTTAQIYQDYTLSPTQVLNTTLYAKVPSGTRQAYFGFFDGLIKTQLKTLTTEWQRIEYTGSIDAGAIRACWFYGFGGDSNVEVHLWGGQLNVGSTAKPYFPTTDRLNVPRLTYQNGGGGCPSLLLEPQRTNLAIESEQLNLWNGANVSVTPNTSVSPDGTQNADNVNITATGGYWRRNPLTFANSTSYTASIFVKKSATTGTKTFRFYYNNNQGSPNNGVWQCVIDLTNITATTTAGGTAGTGSPTILSTNIVDYGSGWYRVEVAFTTGSAAGNSNAEIGFESNGVVVDFLAWGAQVEQSSYATSYIPTTSASATRVADACFKTGISSLIGQSEGTLFAQFNKPIDSVNAFRLNLSDGTTNNWVFIGFEALIFRGYIRASNSVILTNNFIGTANVNKIAIAYKSGDYAIYHNGTQIVTGSSSFTFNGTLSQINVGENPYDDNYAVGQIAEILVSKTRLTNAELASLTTI